MIVYCALAGVVYLIYLAVCIRHEYRRTMDVVNTEEGVPAAVEVTNMPKSRQQSLETGKEILKILEAQGNIRSKEQEMSLKALNREQGLDGTKDVSEVSLADKI
jgi:hypothetical protein